MPLAAVALVFAIGCAGAASHGERQRRLRQPCTHGISWCRDLPEPVFQEFIRASTLLDETCDAWRPVLYAKFAPLVKNCATAEEALAVIHQNIIKETGANYNTKRQRPNQSPLETMKSGMASCTGLSILLAQSCRAMGIPARVAGVADWSDHSGNHTWVEVWLNGGWHFTE